jgi:hypothetical protein
MNRGIIELKKDELEELTKFVRLEKFDLAKENMKETNRIFVNEEELESIMDEIGAIFDNEILTEVKSKISETLLRFRNP